MKKELQDKLFKDYPDLYADRKLSIQESCMPWGIDTGDGWYGIIDELSGYLVAISSKIRATQVKEKYGGLRFYIRFEGNITDEVCSQAYDACDAAEIVSTKTCEECGSNDGVTQTKGWIYTLCPKCLEEIRGNNGKGSKNKIQT